MISPLYLTQGATSFGRVYSVQVQTIDGSVFYGNEKPGQAPLRVSFDVERNVAAPNKGQVAIFNLGAGSRSGFRQNCVIRIRAGYKGNCGTLLLGLANKIETQRQGADIVTAMELVDAEPFTNMSVLDKSYIGPTFTTDILADVAAAMKVERVTGPVTIDHGITIGLPLHVYPDGFVATGPCRDTLDKVCKPLGLEWSVQAGALQIVPKDHYDGRPLQVLSRGTGLIGVPGRGTDCTTMQALLNPALLPGGLVSLRSSNVDVSGIYKLRKVVFKGDSHDAAWQAEMEGVPYQGEVTPLPVAVAGNFATAVVP